MTGQATRHHLVGRQLVSDRIDRAAGPAPRKQTDYSLGQRL